jgi:carboxymuconolactone decarboxylase family protein
VGQQRHRGRTIKRNQPKRTGPRFFAALLLCRSEKKKCSSSPISKSKTAGGKVHATFYYAKVIPGAYHAMLAREHYLHENGLEESLLHLIKLRASQLNGCAYRLASIGRI